MPRTFARTWTGSYSVLPGHRALPAGIDYSQVLGDACICGEQHAIKACQKFAGAKKTAVTWFDRYLKK